MSARVIVRPEAEAELSKAYDWYEARRSGLGDEFLLSIEIITRRAGLCRSVGHLHARRAATASTMAR